MSNEFKETVEKLNPTILQFDRLETIQVNLGNLCNLQCKHCHIEAGPSGDRIMSKGTMEKIIRFLKKNQGLVLDITGGSPELNPHFKFFVETAYNDVCQIMVRTNLCVLLEDGMEWIPPWYRNHNVVIIGSLPCYTKENVDKQRGDGVYDKNIRALKLLNELGYGDSLELNLVYNPSDDFLPGDQQELEQAYKKELFDNFEVTFNHLYTITNAPIGRFREYLTANGRLEQYTQLLKENFNPEAAEHIMCRTLISIGWEGNLYNCDFNQALDMPLKDNNGKIMIIDDIDALHGDYEIITAQHCYCCTAGAGSSCTGVLVGS